VLSAGDPLKSPATKGVRVVVIGIDAHKSSHTAAAVDAATGRLLGELTVRADEDGHHALLRFAEHHGSEREWAIEDWTARLVRVRRSFSRGQWTTPKSRRSVRAVPMPDRVAAELARHFERSMYQRDDDLVFAHPHSGRPYDASRMRIRFKAALQRADLRPLRFHDLRHTYGTLMAAAAAPLRTLQGWMGHRDYKTTEVYADFARDPSQGAVWAERAFGLSAPGDGQPHPLERQEPPRGGSYLPVIGTQAADL
jgi:hypothetical protein